MACNSCGRKRYKEKIIKKGRKTFMVKVCLGCSKEYDLSRVRKSKLVNEWVEEDTEEDK